MSQESADWPQAKGPDGSRSSIPGEQLMNSSNCPRNGPIGMDPPELYLGINKLLEMSREGPDGSSPTIPGSK